MDENFSAHKLVVRNQKSSNSWFVNNNNNNNNLPQFGSFQISAGELQNQGILLAIDGYSSKILDRININIIVSFNEAGLIAFQAYVLGIKIPQKGEVKVTDLLEPIFSKDQSFSIFYGIVRMNVELMLDLIKSKVYLWTTKLMSHDE